MVAFVLQCIGLCTVIVFAMAIIAILLCLFLGREKEEDEQSPNYEICRVRYIDDLLKRPVADLEAMILDIELELDSGRGNVLEYEVQRENLDCLNTAYVLKCANARSV